ncbi:MAG: PP2C family protein-serine/threonine phosphatase [Planctomycetes bacterium]|nr:PP2C family protein-serine/threonine phosphatase [Planctomycetota bacterium]
MTIHQGSCELLAAIPKVLDGVAVEVLDAAGVSEQSFGHVGGDHDRVRAELPQGALLASVPKAVPGLQPLVAALLATVAERERLEADMESMNTSSLRLLEQVSMFGETLPRLSAGGDDAEIASLGVRACQRAASVQQVVYLAHHANKGMAEVVVHFAGESRGKAAAELEPLQPVEGFLADVLAVTEGVVLRSVAADRLGEPGSVEHLAERQVMGVPVTYGAGDKRVLLGVLVLVDKVAAYGGTDADVPLGNEEGQIAESFAAMLGAVLGARQTAAFGKELAMARTIQHQILPEKPAVLGGFDIAARYFACGAVGGDYYDYVPLADGRTMVVIADVSGHNLASGMIMVSARAMLRTLASVHDSPKPVFDDLAKRMFDDLTRTERFLTAAAVALRSGDGGVDYVCAGHNDMLVYRAANDRIESVASESTILGFLPSPEYGVRRVQLQPGDCLLLFTDGITEAIDDTGTMFGDDRLAAVFAQLAPNRSAQRIIDGVLAELETFRRGQVGSDDVTAVVIRYNGPAGTPGDRR